VLRRRDKRDTSAVLALGDRAAGQTSKRERIVNILAELKPHEIHYTPEEKQEIMASMDQILDTGWLILSKYTESLERDVADYLGRKHAIAVSSESAALQIALLLSDVNDGEVLVHANSFHSTYQAVRKSGGTPAFLDVDPEQHGSASAAEIRRRITPKTAAVMIMQGGGYCHPNPDAVRAVCADAGVALVEDFIHAFGADIHGRKAGTVGEISATSLYATKVFHAGNGGVVVTDDDDLADKARMYRFYGKSENWKQSVVLEGADDWRITEMQAAMGAARLRRLDEEIARRDRVAQLYLRHMADLPTDLIRPLPLAEGAHPNWYKFLCLLDDGVDRERFREVMAARGVPIPYGCYEIPTYRHEAVRSKHLDVSRPSAERFCAQSCALPVHGDMTEQQVEFIVAEIVRALEDDRATLARTAA
jgi:perosamine synthetase